MLQAILSIAVASAILIALFATAALGSARLWAGRPYLAVAYGSIGVGLAAMLAFVTTWLNPLLGSLVCWLTIAGCLVYLYRARVWHYWRAALPIGLITGGTLLAYVALVYIWKVPITDFQAVSHHYRDMDTAPDNLIPALFSEDIAKGFSTHLIIGDWNGSDRPPLQSGFILIARIFAQGDGGITSSAFGASLVVQMLWLPTLYALLRGLGVRRIPILLAILLAAVAGTTFFNTVYTWPKLFSAALVLAALTLLVDAIRRPKHFRADFIAAVISFVLAVLAHGVAVFVAPVVIGLGIAAYRHQPVPRWVGTTAIAAGAGILLYLPWTLYQTFADPPGDRLLKWHLAGVIPASDHRPFLTALVEGYSRLSPGQWLHVKLVNFAEIFQLNPFLDLTNLIARRHAEFQLTTIALGVAFPMAVVIAIYLLIKRYRGVSGAHDDRVFWFLTGASILSIVFWCLVMFLPGGTIIQQGSQAWILLLLVAPQLWFAARRPQLAAGVVLLQWAETLVVYAPSAIAADSQFRPSAFVIGVLGAVAVVFGCYLYSSHEKWLLARSPGVRKSRKYANG